MQEYLEHYLGLRPEMQEKIIQSLFVVLLVLLLRHLVRRIALSQIQDVKVRYKWQKASLYLAVLVIIAWVANTWLSVFGSMGTFLGLISAGVAIALKDPLVNAVGWAFILIRQPFRVGDRVQIGSVAGDVVDIRLFQFSLAEIGNWVDADQSTGRIIHVPNGTVFVEPQANYTAGFECIWNEIPVLLTFESDWKKAKAILAEIVRHHGILFSSDAGRQMKEAARKYLILSSDTNPGIFTTVRDSGVLLTLRYMCNPRERRLTEERIWEDILEKFAPCKDIDFAYPTVRHYDNSSEGKR